MSGTPRASPRPAPVHRTPQPPAPRSNVELIAVGKQELQALSTQSDALLQSFQGQQDLINQLTESRNRFTQELDSVHTALEHEEEARLAADQKLRLLEVSSCSLEELVNEGEAARAALEAELNQQAVTLKQTQHDLTESKAQTGESRAKLSEAETAITALRMELDTARQSVSSLEASCAELQVRVKNSEGKACLLDDVFKGRDLLEQKNAELQRIATEAKAEVAQQGARIQQLQAELAEKENQLAAASQQATQQSAMAGDMDDLQWRCEAAEQANATLQAQVKEQLGKMEARIRKAESRTVDKEKECDQYKRALKQAGDQNSSLNESIEGLHLRLEKAEARMNEEALARKREAKRAKQAEEGNKRLQREIKEMKDNLQAAKDGMGMMRTIAKIRNLDDDQLPVGFDAVGERTLSENKAPRKGRRSLNNR